MWVQVWENRHRAAMSVGSYHNDNFELWRLLDNLHMLHTPSCENFLIDQLKALYDQMMLAIARFQVLSPVSCVRYSRCLPIGYRSHLGGIQSKPVHWMLIQKLRVQPYLKIIPE